MNSNTLNTIRDRLIFIEAVQSELKSVLDDFSHSNAGQKYKVSGTLGNSYLSQCGTDIETLEGMNEEPSELHAILFADGHIEIISMVGSISTLEEQDTFESVLHFDPYEDEPHDVAARVCTALIAVPENQISLDLYEHIAMRIGREHENRPEQAAGPNL